MCFENKMLWETSRKFFSSGKTLLTSVPTYPALRSLLTVCMVLYTMPCARIYAPRDHSTQSRETLCVNSPYTHVRPHTSVLPARLTGLAVCGGLMYYMIPPVILCTRTPCSLEEFSSSSPRLKWSHLLPPKSDTFFHTYLYTWINEFKIGDIFKRNLTLLY